MKRIILSILSFVFCYNTFAQSDYYTTIKTPTNVSVEAIYRIEYSAGYLAQVEAQAAGWISDQSSSAVRIAPASRTYNCHNFAWHNSDGGNRVWVNQNDQYGNANLSKYWSGTSPTYQLTTIGNAAKTFYSDGDHSAKVISPTLFESKWGEWPRYQHSPTDCPYVSSNLQYYYVPVNGDGLICTSKTYSTLNISGASYNWSGSKVTISGSGSAISVTKLSDGSGWLQTQISSPYSGTAISSEKQTIWIGKPSILNIDKIGSCYEPTIIYGSPTIDGVNYSWSVNNPSVNMYSSGRYCYVDADIPDGSSVFFTLTSTISGNDCVTSGTKSAIYYKPTVDDCNGGPGPEPLFSVSPNPANEFITIEVKDIEKGTVATSDIANKEFIVRLLNSYQTPVYQMNTISKKFTINVSNYPIGIYYLQIIKDNKMYSEKVIIMD